MAGSYNHCVTDSGKLRAEPLLDLHRGSFDAGDTLEALEEMYGMIWFLADGDADRVEEARQNYKFGIEKSPGVQRGWVQRG